MRKLLSYLDNNILKIGISFLIFFVALYPKLPSIHIVHTWVYIRLEDFFIASLAIIWLIQLFRKKTSLPWRLGSPVFLYWLAGLTSLIFSFIFIAPLLVNFFPTIAVLSYLRRIEYMILFFIAFSTIRSVKDLRDYIVILCLTLVGVITYGLGQKLYIVFWQLIAPLHLTKYFFCFPSFQTGNEEFAKGIPLCLSSEGRITSTFAGHYDLSAYLVLVIPILIGIFFAVRRKIAKLGIGILMILSIIVLNFTASRISFPAYILGGITTLIFLKKKLFIPIFLGISIIILVAFSQSTAKRLFQTFGFASVVIDSQGHIVGEELPVELRRKLTNDNLIIANTPTQNLPRGSSFIGLPQTKAQKTNVAVVRSGLSSEEAKKLKLENGGVELSTVSGNFLVKKVLVYDISFTTRFQAEWPNAIRAFSQNYLLGSGFATITLATDNDFLRLLGETGIFGFISFFLIFLVFAITLREVFPNIKSGLVRAFMIGLFGGIVGLLINATLIDVFESSKVAETLWILLGIGMGSVMLYKKNEIDYKGRLLTILKSSYFIVFLVLIFFSIVFLPSLRNFFVGDDFTWLHWAAVSTVSDLQKYFTHAEGFFYRPIDKILMFFFYTIFSFKPAGYHAVMLLFHFMTGIGVYLLATKLLKQRLLALVALFIFLFLPSQAENIFWISTISTTVSAFFIILGVLAFVGFREKSSKLFYLISVILGILALLSYEMSVIYVLLIVLTDVFISKTKLNYKKAFVYLPFVLMDPAYILIRNWAHAFQASGDYSYNFLHFIPNLVGNFLGYFGLFIFGESSVAFYVMARNALKAESLLILSFIFLATILLIGIVFLTKKRLLNAYQNQKIKIFIYCFLFIFFSLLPFLGLGNITQRYSYLASVGYAFLIAMGVDFAAGLVVSRLKLPKNIHFFLVVVLTALLGAYYLVQLQHSNDQWMTAGKITNRTLSYLKIYKEEVPANSTFYFVNIPIRRENAWIFPVGLSDGVWFVYRDDSLKVEKVETLEKARTLKALNTNNSYIFQFNKNFRVEEIQ